MKHVSNRVLELIGIERCQQFTYRSYFFFFLFGSVISIGFRTKDFSDKQWNKVIFFTVLYKKKKSKFTRMQQLLRHKVYRYTIWRIFRIKIRGLSRIKIDDGKFIVKRKCFSAHLSQRRACIPCHNCNAMEYFRRSNQPI